MALLELKDIEFNYGDKPLYKKVNLKLNKGEHACLIGKNGSGKTTLLSLIVKEMRPDKGEVIWEGKVSFAYLDQQLKVKTDIKLSDYIYGVYSSLFEKEKEMERLYLEASSGNDGYEKLLNKAEKLGDELLNAGFYSIQEKVGRLSDGLGLGKDKMERLLSSLSSGEREKAYLCKMLLEEKDVLIMDEPTNFLDQIQVKWLATFLNEYPNAFLIVSHDESFLSQVGNVFFNLENQTITRYKGDYEFFKTQHQLDKEQYEANYLAQQRYIKKEEDFIAAHIVRATSAKAAKSRRARLAHLDRLEAPTNDESKVYFNFPFSGDVGNKPLEVELLEIGYDHPLLSPISFILNKGEKIAILGRNGVGKTTFIKTILGQINKLGGSYKFLDGIIINYYGQDEAIDLELSPFEYIQSIYPKMNNTEIRTLLGSVGVNKNLALRKFKELSGGEVSKARIAAMCKRKSNFLIFDEPSNHLDIKAKQALYEAIERFPGAVILISHEKDFYDGLVDYELNF